MTLHLHHLTGCAPIPLAHYLKAIGILRLIAQQKDPDVRGFWRDQHFCLLTRLDGAALEAFFLDDYAPTSIFNPWGARSGFYPGSSEKTARERLNTIEKSSTERLASFRHDIASIRDVVKRFGGRKPEGEQAEANFIGEIRSVTRGSAAEWMSTVAAVVGSSQKFPALMGTGGNEGSGGYPSAYVQSVIECVLHTDRRRVAERLSHALFGDSEFRPGDLWNETFGQFLPNGNGSAWDFLLAFEGAVSFRSSITRRAAAGPGDRFLSSPFFLPHHALGTASTARIDEYAVNKGRENPGRGEQWFPLWESPASFDELSATISDGRCSVGRQTARRPLDAAQAISQRGVAQGITGFVRYGYLQRRNMATHLAVPLGVLQVREHGASRLLDEIRPWLVRVHREARKKGAETRSVLAERKLSESAFLAVQSNAPRAWQDLLVACSSVELLHASGTGFGAGPCPTLSPGWLAAAEDDSPEWRLALSLGSAAREYQDGRPLDSVRAHALPIDPKKGWSYEIGADTRLTNNPRVVMAGRDPMSDLIALVERRLVEASQRGSRTLPLVARRGTGARLADLARFIVGQVDAERVVALGRALMALDWERVRPSRVRVASRGPRPDEPWEALRLCMLPFPVRERSVATEPAVFRRLATGDMAGAVELALRRLRASGFRPPLAAASADPRTARHWAAALAFPIDPAVATAMADRFEASTTRETA
jgi:CRISPR-associated protein Csx17